MGSGSESDYHAQQPGHLRNKSYGPKVILLPTKPDCTDYEDDLIRHLRDIPGMGSF